MVETTASSGSSFCYAAVADAAMDLDATMVVEMVAIPSGL